MLAGPRAGARARAPRSCSPNSTFSSAVRCGNRLYAWNTMPMSRLLAGSAVTSLPPTSTWPGVGVLEPGEHPQRGRLAAAGRAEQGDQLAGRERRGRGRRGRARAERAAQALGRAAPALRPVSMRSALTASRPVALAVGRPAATDVSDDEQDERDSTSAASETATDMAALLLPSWRCRPAGWCG